MANPKLVKVCRTSGMSVKIEHMDMYKNEYRAAYDKMIERLELQANAMLSEDQAKRMEKVMARVERILLKKYPNTDYWPYITSRKAWKAKIKQHGPIFVALDSSTSDISYVILDTPLS